MKYVIRENGEVLHESKTYDHKGFAIMDAIKEFLDMIGYDGDGENEGKGSLVNCMDDMFNWLWNGYSYSYADLSVGLVEVA